MDDGYLLRRIIWPRHGSYGDVYSAYVIYVQKHHGTDNVVIVLQLFSKHQGCGTKSPIDEVAVDLNLLHIWYSDYNPSIKIPEKWKE